MRIFSTTDEHTARVTLAGSNLLYALFYLGTFLIVPIAAIAIVGVPALGANPDMAYPLLLAEIWPPILVGLAVAGIFAAFMSSADSLLLACSAAVSHDIYKHCINLATSDRRILRISMISILVIGVILIYFAMRPLPIIAEVAGMAAGLFTSSLFVPLILGIWWNRLTKWGSIASSIAGLIVFTTLWSSGLIVPAMAGTIISLPVAILVAVIVSLFTKPPSREIIQQITEMRR